MKSKSDKSPLENGACIATILITNEEVAQQLLNTKIGNQPALHFGLHRWTATRKVSEVLILVPVTLEQSLRDQIVEIVREFPVNVISIYDENPFRTLLQAMESASAQWVAIIQISDIFVDGSNIDSCLLIIARLSVEYIYGRDYPNGARPLIISKKIVDALAAYEIFPDYSIHVGMLLNNNLLNFQGIVLPSPPNLQATNVDLSITSIRQSAVIEEIAQFLISQHRPLTITTFVRAIKQHDRTRLRATFRFVRLRPRRKTPQKRKKTSVLCLSFRAEKIGGGDTSFQNLLLDLDQTKFQPLHATSSQSGLMLDNLRKLDIPTICVPSLHRTYFDYGKYSFLLPAVMQLTNFATRHNCDLIYANNNVVGWLGGVVALTLGLPLVGRVIEEIDKDTLEQSLISLADLVAVPSYHIANYCKNLGIPSDRLRVVHEGVDSSWFEPTPLAVNLRELCNFSPKTRLIGVVSRLDDPNKNLDRAIASAAAIINKHPDVRMVFCGKTSWGGIHRKTRLLQQIEQLGLENHVRLAGFFPDMRGIYPQFDMLLHPAPREPFGLILTEAMAKGVPVVAVRGGGVPEQVVDGQTGLLVASNHPKDLAQAALHLLEQPNFGIQLGIQGQEHVRRNFTSAKFARGMEAVFDEIICWQNKKQNFKKIKKEQR